ncbi:hypothetical protein EDB81DRAFT_772779 [Dactylonectria macrodidyma]|uniref:Uncharacterized protein n=1 Tax=Dactylonectria macrodidyma TaxID=307937 RepID=A0A9P9JJ19_9HYPO|nr:hypothetical protein EDB81DRAFT_772779 [Dactylonectria macrodidyma]
MAMASAPRAPRLLPLSMASLRRAYSAPVPPFPPQHIKDLPRQFRKESDKVPKFDTTERRAKAARKGAARVKPRDSSGAPSTRGKPSDKNRKHEMVNPHRRHGPMYVPQVAQAFFRNGKLQTTPDVWEFLQDTGIEYDNSKSNNLPLAPEHKHIAQTFACRIKYSKFHILHPYHLIFLQPRGHPAMEGLKVRYRIKLKEQPLWIHFTAANGDTGLIRSIGQRRLLREFWLALEELGGRGPETMVSGTLILTMFDAKKAASAPAWQFGQALAAAVVKQYKWDNSEHWNLRARKELKSEPLKQGRKP